MWRRQVQEFKRSIIACSAQASPYLACSDCVQVDVAQVQNFRRSILDFRIEELPGCAWGGRRLLQLHIRGTAFLWHQVCVCAVCAVCAVIV